MELDNKLSIKDIYKIIGILIILSAFSAIILNFVLQIDLPPYIKISTNSTWIGFWGNLIGTIIGACVTMIGLIMTFKENQHQIEEEKKFNIIFNLICDIFHFLFPLLFYNVEAKKSFDP